MLFKIKPIVLIWEFQSVLAVESIARLLSAGKEYLTLEVTL